MNDKAKKRGRPRREAIDDSILQATRALLVKSGVNNFSMNDVAMRAGVSKPTIYLRWKNKEELISDAIGLAYEQIHIPDTGNAIQDLRILLTEMLDAMNNSFDMNPPHKIIAGIFDTPTLWEQYEQNFIVPRRRAYAIILRRGIDRGEIRKNIDEDILIDLISGSYFYCLLLYSPSYRKDEWLTKAFDLIEKGIVI